MKYSALLSGKIGLIIMSLFISTCQSGSEARPSLQEVYQAGMAAYEAGEFSDYLKAMKRAHDVRPHHPSVVYNLASAQALTGNHDSALFWLNRFADLGFAAHPEQDSDFVSLQPRPLFQAVIQRISANERLQGDAEIAFSLPDSTLLTEGIATDSRSHTFFVSSIYQRKIVKIDATGKVRTFIPSRKDDLGSAFGMAVDTAREVLWIASTIMDLGKRNRPGETIGECGVFAFQLHTGDLVQKILLPADTLNHLFGDLTVTPDGDVYVSDGGAGTIYRLKSNTSTLEPLFPPGAIGSPQGLVYFEEYDALILADYATGLYRINLSDNSLLPLKLAQPMCLLGIDGLVTDGAALYAIQNGIRPHRVVKLTLDWKRNRVSGLQVLAANHPDFDEPTLGVTTNGWLYFNGTSQWRLLSRTGDWVNPEALQPPKIFRVPL
ncbi:MAG: hypothetical protein K9N11_07155 [Lentisphaeria bacterium]|nr:hypothetical protein [Candidatus Neomarinimicrobiota bacterium]MCF7842614.1 hypothetical protein [Lentisphaeria bacterium]